MKTKMAFIISVFPLAGLIQAQGYQVDIKTEQNYQALSNPTPISGQTINSFYVIAVPFPFDMYGGKYKFSFSPGAASSDGWAAADGVVSTSGKRMAFDGFLANMQKRDSTSLLSYIITGGFGNRILKFEWKNMALAGNPSSDYVNMQLWFHEADFSMSVHIGAINVTGKAAYNNEDGPVVGFLVANDDFTTVYESFYLEGNPVSPTPNKTLPFARLSATPSKGTIYTFTYGTSSIQDNEIAYDYFSVYPNPASGHFYISFPGQVFLGSALSLADLTGAVLRRTIIEDVPVIEKELVFSSQGLLPGIYIVTIEGAEARSAKKLVVQ